MPEPSHMRLLSVQKDKYQIALIAIGFCLASAGASLFFANKNIYASSNKILRYSYVLTNESPQLITDARFKLAIPMQIDEVQTINSIISSYGNRVIHDEPNAAEFILEDFAPHSSKIIDLTLNIVITNKPTTEIHNTDSYLSAQKYIEIQSPEIKELANKLRGKTAMETARNIHQWLVNNIDLSGYTADSKGAAYLLKTKTGDCTEFMYAFIALTRANEIPARGVNGFWIREESSLINSADYHDWAEFYDGNRWVLVDPLKNIFDSDYGNYVAIFIHAPGADSKRFSVTNENIRVSY